MGLVPKQSKSETKIYKSFTLMRILGLVFTVIISSVLSNMILSISLDTFSTQNAKQVRNHLSKMEQISMERSGMDICSISGAARSGG